MGVAALVLGILSIPLAIVPLMFWLGLLLGLLALVFGLVGRASAKRKGRPTSVATAGLVVGIIGTVFSVLMWVRCYMAMRDAEHNFNKALQGLDDKKLNEEFNKAFEKALEESQKGQKK